MQETSPTRLGGRIEVELDAADLTTEVLKLFLHYGDQVESNQEQSAKQSSAAAELGLANVGGVFVVLIGGMGLATIVAICEFIWNARELATDENASFCEELGTEVSFILKCSGNTKPVRKKYPSTPEEQLFTYGSYGASYGYSNKK